jgi:hypothetical protein
MNDSTKRCNFKIVDFQTIMGNINEVDWIKHFNRMPVDRCVALFYEKKSGGALTSLF